jgi:capsular polysaccharide biosynthesis protein
MKQRAAECLFRHKLLILLPLVVILPITVLFAARPKPAEWQSFVVVFVDQYKPLYEDERLGYAPGPNQAQLLNGFFRTRSFARSVLSQTQLSEAIDDPQTEMEAIHRLWNSVQIWPTNNNLITIVVTMPNPDLAYETAMAIVKSYEEMMVAQAEAQSQAGLRYYADALKKAEEAYAKSQTELNAYLAARPHLAASATDPTLPLAARDVTLARLTAQARNDEQTYGNLRQRYDQLQSSTGAASVGRPFAFTIVDEPQRPISPVPYGRLNQLKLPVIGLTLALMLSSGIAAFLVLTSRAVFDTEDVQRAIGVPVLGEIPVLRRRRWPWQRSPRDAVRLLLAAPARPATSNAGRTA